MKMEMRQMKEMKGTRRDDVSIDEKRHEPYTVEENVDEKKIW